MHRVGWPARYLIAALLTIAISSAVAADPLSADISYSRDVLPILQAHCHGCHQPAKAEGSFDMTSFDRLLAGGETKAAIEPGASDQSYLVERIQSVDGDAEMPPQGPALSAQDVTRIRQWIDAGAQDDSPPRPALPTMDQPPTYVAPPVVTALDATPDGTLLAVAGYHEVLILDTTTWETAARLAGMSPRIQSVAFSPDGQLLAMTGGQPAVAGEVQIWDVAARSLLLSIPVSHDTVYGASWSPDGKRVAFGCADNSVRVIDAESGQQVMFQASHNDWVLDTAFSKDGKHLVSAGRDRTAKLILIEEERFIDNITSITPGALKGGITTVDRHPDRDELLIGSSDGVPQIFRMQRVAKRRIGDNSNLIRHFPPVAGRIFTARYSPDGKRIAVAASLDGIGAVHVYAANFDATVSDALKVAFEQVAPTPEQRTLIDTFQSQDVERLASASFDTALYALDYLDEQTLAVAGGDGMIRLIDATTCQTINELIPFTVAGSSVTSVRHSGLTTARARQPKKTDGSGDHDARVRSAEIVRLIVQPEQIHFSRTFDTAQCIVLAELPSGEVIDVTRMTELVASVPCVAVDERRMISSRSSGSGTLRLAVGAHEVELGVRVELDESAAVDYLQDVAPILSRLGCNAGTCHGAKNGKNGFKLSLRGYDPASDVRALTDDLASRRVNLAVASESLMLRKATGRVPHTGGQLTTTDQRHYRVLEDWIAGGAKQNPTSARVASISIFPEDPTIAQPGGQQQFRVVATYTDGTRRDVTADAFLTSGNTEVAETEDGALLTALRRGEAPVLARYEGAYAATTLTVMGDRDSFVWHDPPEFNFIDGLVYDKLRRLRTAASDLCTDAEFIRRVTLDLTGLPPTADQVEEFLSDDRPTRMKRDELVDRLVGSDDYIEHWTNKWADLLQVNRKTLGTEGAASFRNWIRGHIARNTPYDTLAHEILTVSGSNRDLPQAGYFKTLRTPQDTMENTTHLFLAVRFNCNKCHDHPFERWTQDQYYELAAYFAQTRLTKDEASGDRTIGGTDVEQAKPLFEIVSDASEGEIKHERTGVETAPQFPYPCEFDRGEKTRRAQLAAWITSPDNQYFAKSYVNRLWGYLFGIGIIEPIDDIRAGNPPTNPELLDELTRRFVESGFNVRQMLRTICKSRVYQLSSTTNRWNEDDRTNYSHAFARRLPAEVLYDSIHRVTGAQSAIPDYEGLRAAELPDAGVKTPSGFLDQLGRPSRESACECERVNTLQLGPVMTMISGPTVNGAVHQPDNAIARLTASIDDDGTLIRRLFLRILNRPASDDQVTAALETFESVADEHAALVTELDAAEREFAPLIALRTKQREQAIATTKQALDDYADEATAVHEEKERQRIADIDKATKELDAFVGTWLAERADKLQQESAKLTEWYPLEFDALSSTNNATLTQQEDKAVVAIGPNGKTIYHLRAPVPIHRVTGIRLEALADANLPAGGPGRSPSGNFVVNEFRVASVSNYDAADRQPVKLAEASADFSQPKYEIAKAIDGKIAPNEDGWAIAGEYDKDHVAVFECATPIVMDKTRHLAFELEQQYVDSQHSLGRFRLLVTGEKLPLAVAGISSDVSAALATSADGRTRTQIAALRRYGHGQDETWKKLLDQFDKANAAEISPDEKLVGLQQALQQAKQPVRIPPRLQQLRSDATVSEEHMNNPRLTAAQDLAWALINSPAFLFNH